MTTYLFIVLSLYFPAVLLPIRPSPWFIFLIFLMTFILPALNFLFFRVSGSIRDITMVERRDRVMPFTFVTILYCVVTLMFYWKFPVPNVLRIMGIITATVIVSTIVTIFYKVSVHSVSIWGLLGILIPLNKAAGDGAFVYATVGLLVIAGIIMSSRLLLNVHAPREVLVGGVMGFVVAFAGMMILF